MGVASQGQNSKHRKNEDILYQTTKTEDTTKTRLSVKVGVTAEA
jgi:hypothetical protein